MRRRSMIAVLLAILGCGPPTVDSVCGDLSDKHCANATCVDDGNSLGVRATSAGCTRLFDAYVDCIDQALCSYDTVCAAQRAALVGCTGPFAPP